MKIAHIILTHEKPYQLQRLVAKLSHPNASIFIHVDLKKEMIDFSVFDSVPNVYLIKNRVNVKWGGFSMIQATLNSCKEVIESGISFDYVNLLSAQDYPIKSIRRIHQFLEANPGKAFMEFYSIKDVWTEAIPRLEKYHLTDFTFKGNSRIEYILNLLLPKRKLPKGLIPVGRSQWFTITLEHVKYVIDYLNKNTSVISFFKYTWGSDEIVFHTILYNSQYRDSMVNNNLRYIDWSEKKANPKTFTMQDSEVLKKSDKLFARKFNVLVDSKILDYIDSFESLSESTEYFL